MSIERLSGGLTPADGSDPRTFPAIFNEFADEFEDKNIPAFGTATPSDGDALVYNDAEGVYEPGEGGGLPSNAYAFVETVTFTSNGTFTKASYPWLRAIRVKLVGGGGGSGGNQNTGNDEQAAGAGGGGGAYAESFITNIAGLSASETVTVGLGGAKGLGGASSTSGSSGGTSSFGSLVSAEGGSPGFGGNASGPIRIRSSSPGGVTAVGDLTIGGGAGQGGLAIDGRWIPLGGGGSSFLAGASASQLSNPFGNDFGGGSGGRLSSYSVTDGDGGDGGDGIVFVELYA